MCGGGKPKTPDLPPTPAPTPVPQPSTVNPQATEGQRASRIGQLKKGIMSTIKTAPYGISGTGANLAPMDAQGSKKTLGS